MWGAKSNKNPWGSQCFKNVCVLSDKMSASAACTTSSKLKKSKSVKKVSQSQVVWQGRKFLSYTNNSIQVEMYCWKGELELSEIQGVWKKRQNIFSQLVTITPSSTWYCIKGKVQDIKKEEIGSKNIIYNRMNSEVLFLF